MTLLWKARRITNHCMWSLGSLWHQPQSLIEVLQKIAVLVVSLVGVLESRTCQVTVSCNQIRRICYFSTTRQFGWTLVFLIYASTLHDVLDDSDVQDKLGCYSNDSHIQGLVQTLINMMKLNAKWDLKNVLKE